MHHHPKPTEYDVIICGAGPVGLFLACELALAKCSVLVLEKHVDPLAPVKQAPFGVRGLNAPSIETLDRRGLLDQLQLHKTIKNPHQNAGQGSRRQVGHFAGIPFCEGDIDPSQWPHRLSSSKDTSLISEIAELETVLTRRAEALGVMIKRGVTVRGFHQTESQVTVQSDNGPFAGCWLVGCDGARSVVRKSGGFAFLGTEPEFTGYSVKMDLADPEKLKPGRNLTSTGLYLMSQPGYLAIQDFDGGAFHGAAKSITIDHIQEVLRRVSQTDVTVTNIHFATTWTDRARQAATYRNGRVLLAGDAAHIHSPLGGQGLNLGLGDATNLGWKLASTIHNRAAPGLLDSYEAERHPIGLQVLDWTRAQVAIMRTDLGAHALNAIVRDLMKTRDGATYFAARVWGIFTNYNQGTGHPLVGSSAPNFAFVDGTTLGERMRDGKGLLLDFSGSHQLRMWADGYKGGFSYMGVAAQNQLDLTAVLIRPDGVVAWASAGDLNDLAFLQAADRWFTK